MLTGRWRRVWSVHLIKVKSFGSDQTLRGEWPDAEGQRPVDSNKVPERENHNRTCSVNADRMLANVRSHFKHWSSGCTDRSVRSPRRGT